MVELMFWISLIILIYVNIGYIFYLIIWNALFSNPVKTDDNFLPSLTLIIPAYNEEKHIAQKLDNALSMDYPKDKFEIVVSSDNSDDKTTDIVNKYVIKYPDIIKLNDFKTRSGKLGVINKSVESAKGNIIVLTDANAMFSEESFKYIVKYFADENVGIVSGAKVIKKENLVGEGESKYWKLESFLKTLESRISSCAGADGAIYAIRKELYPYPDDKELYMDDFFISLSVMHQDRRCIYDANVRAFEGTSKSIKDEFQRKGRIFAGAFNVLINNTKLLKLNYNGSFHLWSHKILRWFSWLFLLILLLSNYILINKNIFFSLFMILQSVIYIFAFVGFLMELMQRRNNLFYIPFYFMFMVMSQFYGLLILFRDKTKPSWDKLDR